MPKGRKIKPAGDIARARMSKKSRLKAVVKKVPKLKLKPKPVPTPDVAEVAELEEAAQSFKPVEKPAPAEVAPIPAPKVVPVKPEVKVIEVAPATPVIPAEPEIKVTRIVSAAPVKKLTPAQLRRQRQARAKAKVQEAPE